MSRRSRLPKGSPNSRLVDVSSGTELRIDGGLLSVTQPLFSVTKELPGDWGRLSLDGNYVIVNDAEGVPVLLDTRTGLADETWFRDEWRPVAAAFNRDVRVVWVVDDGDDTLGILACNASRRYINSFNPANEPCTQVFDLQDTIPVLPPAAPSGRPVTKGGSVRH